MNLTNRMDDETLGFIETKITNPNSTYLTFGKGDSNPNMNDHTMSEEDEPSFMEDGHIETCNRSKGRKGNSSSFASPWQRMKWSDSRVRLLIQVVACVGDDDVAIDKVGSRKCLQKKGKWKTVSKMMESKGCRVSPQQCEDKFNDLNKRYKRLNDILGRGICCKVVENPLLMESIPRLTSKMKEDVKKILNSKHLFYPEMCAYHNGQRIPNCAELGQCGSKENLGHSCDETENNAESDDDDDGDDDDDLDHEHDDDGHEGHVMGHVTGHDSFRDEMNGFFEDANNSKVQKKEWVKKRMLQLHEQQIGIEIEGFEMEKRRFKWERFCDRKDRELEISRLENERLMLENERMVLQLKHTTQVVDSD